jgi:outer membrane protein OmpA-like peptidoglycan-associated protein
MRGSQRCNSSGEPRCRFQLTPPVAAHRHREAAGPNKILRRRVGIVPTACHPEVDNMNSSTHSKARNQFRSGVLIVAALVATGCADMSERQKGTAVGAGVGAGAGAVISNMTGGRGATGAVIGGALGAVAGNLWSKRMEDRRNAMEQATKGTNVEVTRTADNQLKINIPNDISFDTGSAAIKPQLRTVLDPFANSLRDDPAARLMIVGHTDNTGSDAVNNPLSVERAQSVRDYLSSRGVATGRIDTAGRGEREPIAENTTDAGRAKNRRVEIFLREPAPA